MSTKRQQVEGQISLFDFIPEQKTEICGYVCDVEWCSMVCFKRRGYIWDKKAHSWVYGSDGKALRTKTRECDWDPEPAVPIDVRGLMDDPYCPKCGRGFWTETKKSEVDCERCPDCGTRLDWTPWHRLNDEENQREK